MSTMVYHQPAMLQECLDGLDITPNGVYVDATFGGGGHSFPLIDRLSNQGHLVAFDRDGDAIQNLKEEPRLTLVPHNYAFIEHYLRYLKYFPVDGILADLGISTWQIDHQERGFSYRFDEAVLDMRMDGGLEKTASEILNNYNASQLQSIFSMYGEIKNSKTLAEKICHARSLKPLETVKDLVQIAEKIIPRGDNLKKYLGPIFQALRIEVNDELLSLKQFLIHGERSLKIGGRFCIITYHSLEDRMVKNFFQQGSFEEKDASLNLFGGEQSIFKLISRKPTVPSDEEILSNPRVRTAKLRVAEKINHNTKI